MISEHDQPWYSDPDYDRSGQLINPPEPDPDEAYERLRDAQEEASQ